MHFKNVVSLEIKEISKTKYYFLTTKLINRACVDPSGGSVRWSNLLGRQRWN